MIGKTISHYKIIEKLGEGGMGVVYRAEDNRLKRSVALKFLPKEWARNNDARERFNREAKVAAALNHPNIVTIYEINEHEDQIYIAMEYVEGETLKDKIAHGPLPIAKTIEVASQICEALQKAHDAGIIHRDIKPQNIIINKEGRVKILDFGLAKLKGVSQLTKESSTLGTVHYLSPEQALGKDVDHRTDIWSLGVVLYEMLTGELPFKGEYEQVVIYSIVNESPQPSLSNSKNIPRHLMEIACKALEKAPGNRFQSTDEIIRLLQTPTQPKAEIKKQKCSIIVLPFVNMSPDPDQEYFSDGLTEEIISDLSQILDCKVISRTSTMMLKNTQKDLKTIGRELNVQYVLEGSVRKASNKIRITAQLIDAEEDDHLWAQKYNGSLQDVFEIQEKVSRAIVDELKLTLSPQEEKGIQKHPIENVSAYEYYLKAYHEIWKFSESGLDRALEYLRNGLRIIGDNAYLQAAISFVYWQYVNIGVKQEEAIEKAREHAKRALQIDPEFSKAHTCLGYIERDFFGNIKGSMSYFKKAISLNSSDLEAIHGLTAIYCWTGKTESAQPLAEKMAEIDPLNPFTYFILAIIRFFSGDYSQAQKLFDQAYTMNPQNPVFQLFYALILVVADLKDKAIAIIDRHWPYDSQNMFARLLIFTKYSLKKDIKQALSLMTPDFIKTCKRDFGFSYLLAEQMIILGEREKAIDWLEQAVRRGFLNHPFLSQYDPLLENLRKENRFKRLEKRVKKEWENFEV